MMMTCYVCAGRHRDRRGCSRLWRVSGVRSWYDRVRSRKAVGVDCKTVRKYVASALAAGLSLGGPANSAQAWAELVRGQATFVTPVASIIQDTLSKQCYRDVTTAYACAATGPPRVTSLVSVDSLRPR
jgi:hypothetical protein